MSTFDISVLTPQDFCLDVYTLVTSKFKNITRKRVDDAVHQMLDRFISGKLRDFGNDRDKVKNELIKIRESAVCKDLAIKITDLVLELRFILIDFHNLEEPDTPLSENSDNEKKAKG